MRIKVTALAVMVAASLLELAPPAAALPPKSKVQTYKSGLNFPIDMAWVPGTKRVFFTEKSGKIRIMNGRRLNSRACATLNVNDSGERGLLGIALHPKFERNRYLYVYFTKASPLQHQVKRFTVRKGRCRNPKVIVKGISAASSGYHNGGQIEFAGGKLYVSTGEQHDPGLAQDTGNRLGKILRYNPNGSVPRRSNPFGNAVWSYGHRNPFGLAHKPGTKKIYSTENGPDCDDEFNVIKKGRNYGWGHGYRCGTRGVGPNPKKPEVRWSNIIVPTDPTFYKGRMKKLNGDVYMGDFRGNVRRLEMNSHDTRVRRQRVILSGQNGITDVTKGPGGWLYFATTNAIRRIVPE